MALGNREKQTFATIKKGKLRVSVPPVEDGEKWTEEEFEKVNGLLTKISYATREKTDKMTYDPEREVRLTLFDGGESVVVCVPTMYAPGRAVQKMLPNVDPDKELTISVKPEKKGEFNSTTVFFNQEGPVKYFWKKDDMKDLPPGEEYADRKGKTQWDTTAQVAYLEEYIMANVAPLFHEPVTSGSFVSDEVDDGNWEEEESDAPF